MKNTSILSALVLSLVLTGAGSNVVMAQEYITTQSTETDKAVDLAIERAKEARAEAIKAAEAGSVRGKQISEYIDGILTTAQNNSYAESDELIRALNDAAIATPLLLGTNQNNTSKTTSSSNSSATTRSNTQIIAEQPTASAKTVANVESVTTKTDTSKKPAVDLQVTVSESAKATPVITTPKASTAAGTKVSLEVKAQPEATTAVAAASDMADDKIILASATIANNLDVTAAEPEVPNTGEAKNTVGRIIATTVAAIVAMFGAVLIVKRIKKNA